MDLASGWSSHRVDYNTKRAKNNFCDLAQEFFGDQTLVRQSPKISLHVARIHVYAQCLLDILPVRHFVRHFAVAR